MRLRVDKLVPALALLAVAAAWQGGSVARAQVRINEIVTDPWRDWSDTAGGNGVAFDDRPGTAGATDSDEWIELLNTSRTAVNLTSWTLVMIDSTPTSETLRRGRATLVFSAGSSLENLLPGGRLVIGNPLGAMNDDCLILLRDPSGQTIDAVELGSRDYAGDGPQNNAPNGNASAISDEAVARVPDGVDRGDPSRDFQKTMATIGAPNPDIPPLARVLINEIVTDPQRDWNDSSGGNGVNFDDRPGTGAISAVDEWIELVNASTRTVSLIGWTLLMIDTTPATETLGFGSAVSRFERGGSLGALAPGEHAVIGNPAGAMNNEIWIRLIDREGRLVDDVELGKANFRGNGPGDEASNGDARSMSDESIARDPEAADTGVDAADFKKSRATIGRANGSTRASRWRKYK